MIERRVGFIGGGRMAEALIRGMIAAEAILARNVFVSDPAEGRREVLSALIGPNVFAENGRVLEAAEVIVLSVKPQVLPLVVGEIEPMVTAQHLIVSIVPGATMRWLEEKLGQGRIIRVMPNTPCLVGAGAAAFCRGSRVNEADATLVREMLSSVGICAEVDERHMDAVTGLSGSGPAYVYMIIEALADGGVKMGLARSMARRFAAQTVMGAAKMVLESTLHPAELKDQVVTPGGTTIEGIHALEKGGLRAALIGAVEAAARKSSRLAAGPR